VLINEVLVNRFDYQGKFVVKGSTRKRWPQNKYWKISLIIRGFFVVIVCVFI
jgi:hypothetical protein